MGWNTFQLHSLLNKTPYSTDRKQLFKIIPILHNLKSRLQMLSHPTQIRVVLHSLICCSTSNFICDYEHLHYTNCEEYKQLLIIANLVSLIQYEASFMHTKFAIEVRV